MDLSCFQGGVKRCQPFGPSPDLTLHLLPWGWFEAGSPYPITPLFSNPLAQAGGAQNTPGQGAGNGGNWGLHISSSSPFSKPCWRLVQNQSGSTSRAKGVSGALSLCSEQKLEPRSLNCAPEDAGLRGPEGPEHLLCVATLSFFIWDAPPLPHAAGCPCPIYK